MRNIKLIVTEYNEDYQIFQPLYAIRQEEEFGGFWVARGLGGDFIDTDKDIHVLFKRIGGLEDKKGEQK